MIRSPVGDGCRWRAKGIVTRDHGDGADRIDRTRFGVQTFAALSAATTGAGGDAFIGWSVFGGVGIPQTEGAPNGGDFIFRGSRRPGAPAGARV